VIDSSGGNALIVDTPNAAVANTGTLEATAAGGLLIQNIAVDNAGGVISADGGNVNLQSATITGGTLETSNGGVINAINNASTLDGTNDNTVDNTGTVAVDKNEVLLLQGAIDNAGTIALESQGNDT
jgi:hypothetical protein